MTQQDRCSLIINETNGQIEATQNNGTAVPQLKRNTPILFSTNRGLHLRLTTMATTALTTTTTTSIQSNNNLSLSHNNSTYSIVFCDLERWVCNRLNLSSEIMIMILIIYFFI